MTSFKEYKKTIGRIYQTSVPTNSVIVGTGFLVSSQYILTCAHVVIQALGLNEDNFQDLPRGQVRVDFPEQQTKFATFATVEIWQPNKIFMGVELSSGKDIALLRLEHPVPDNEITIIPLTSKTNFSVEEEIRRFKLLGFPEFSDDGKVTEGEILDENEYRLQLQTTDDYPKLSYGFSGSPLWNDSLKSIVGMAMSSSDDTENKEAYALPSIVLRNIWSKQGQLIELLTPYADQKWVKEAYLDCRQKKQNWNTKQPETLVETITDLYQMDEKTDQYVADFVVYLLVKSQWEETFKLKLRNWLNKALGFSREQIAQKCDRVTLTQQQNDPFNSRLWLILGTTETHNHYQLESARFIRDIDSYNPNEETTYKDFKVPQHDYFERIHCREQICSLLTDIIFTKVPTNTGELTIEVFLPFKSLEDLAPDSWLIKDEYDDDPFPLGNQYPVLIRIRERSEILNESDKPPYPYFSKWQNKWKPCNQSNTYFFSSCRDGLVCCDSSENLTTQLQEGKGGLRSKRPLKNHTKKLSAKIMREGIPICLWLRQPLESCECQEEYEKVLDLTLRSLPEKLRLYRTDNPQNTNHFARHVNLLWDDPNKLIKTPSKLELPTPK